MARVVGFVLVAVLLVAVIWYVLKKKKQKSDCEKVAGGAVAVGEAYEGDKISDSKKTTDSIVSAGCSVLGAVVTEGVAAAGATGRALADSPVGSATKAIGSVFGQGSHGKVEDQACPQLVKLCNLGGAGALYACPPARAKGCTGLKK